MHKTRPDPIFMLQVSKIKVLRFLFAEKDEHTGRGITKSIGMSLSAIHKVLSFINKIGNIAEEEGIIQ